MRNNNININIIYSICEVLKCETSLYIIFKLFSFVCSRHSAAMIFFIYLFRLYRSFTQKYNVLYKKIHY